MYPSVPLQGSVARTQEDYDNAHQLNGIAYETDHTQEADSGHRRENLTLVLEQSRLSSQ
jgi:hypothetical protein